MSFVKIGDLQINEEGNIFTWEITQDLPLLEKHEVVVSDTFNFHNDDKKVFQLEVRHCINHPIPPDCQSTPECECEKVWRLYLRCIDQDSSIDRRGYNIIIFKNGEIFDGRHALMLESEAPILNMCETHVKQFVRSEDDIKIQCKLNYLESELYDLDQDVRPKLNFERMFLDKKYSDILLKTACGKEIPAHKVVLAVASPMFDVMFNHDMIENKCQLVDIDVDISYDTAVEMLRYIYTGSFETQEFSTTAELLAAADKYQIRDLKIKCERILGSKLSTENAMDTLRMADTYGAERLKIQTIDFIRNQSFVALTCNEISNMLLGKKTKE
ncbi:speckle-type POZ protein-like A [Trichogramma pretiosum]|uniref:speckle-type POZ protein-like A n=1 Tax=Trichogramma pretiosum TaxID=7493 RepID=UPI0006C97020|nr:speckle-type POZ protein-like A [Trichogramma pretiosum]